MELEFDCLLPLVTYKCAAKLGLATCWAMRALFGTQQPSRDSTNTVSEDICVLRSGVVSAYWGVKQQLCTYIRVQGRVGWLL